MIWAVLLLAVVATVSAQTPRDCSGAAQFTGRFRRMDRERNYFVEGKIFYDSVNKRIREFEFEDINSTKTVYDKLRLHNLNIEYTVDLKTRKCNVTTPRHGFRPYGVPPGSRFLKEGTLGAVGVPNEEVTVAFFEGEFDNKDYYFVSVTEPSCFPVQSGFYSAEVGSANMEFYDLVSGITDPMAFIPPQECL